MAIQARSCDPSLIKLGLALIALSIAGYILGPPLYWHVKEGFAVVSRSSSSSSCPPCFCDCPSQPVISIPEELRNSTFAGCVKHDPEVSQDTEKNFADLLLEELKLKEAEASESHRRADMALLEAKKMTSQYQKEADKCNSGMETCEEAREKAEAVLAAQKRLTATWEQRARQWGWKEGAAKSRTQKQGNIQTA
ncbi:uncharacterized protein LOC111486163 isoform X1 [Cucurbita maxima]|uniref:Uncharacterized protein LOC111486163 isoform X1 n=1 Tax=Cucurbita maxima TaxID=3661 RepID=A0A6J1JN14_CUCMA|nr:uncharacterized protein LOC111486163 isoform X1 [Cucurbita maxima]XP_022988960.1 uncharacterized protein LOC111486163 isoform X1 [Cucurbita maxima]